MLLQHRSPNYAKSDFTQTCQAGHCELLREALACMAARQQITTFDSLHPPVQIHFVYKGCYLETNPNDEDNIRHVYLNVTHVFLVHPDAVDFFRYLAQTVYTECNCPHVYTSEILHVAVATPCVLDCPIIEAFRLIPETQEA